MDKGAIFSDCKRYRYHLWRRWSGVLPPLGWIMLNPSTADETFDDATIKRCMGFAQNLGYGGIVVANLYAWRATKPYDLKAAIDPVGPRNAEHIRGVVRAAKIVIAAWGQHDSKLFNLGPWWKQAISEESPGKLHSLRLNADGTPGHPLYLPEHLQPRPYEIEALV